MEPLARALVAAVAVAGLACSGNRSSSSSSSASAGGAGGASGSAASSAATAATGATATSGAGSGGSGSGIAAQHCGDKGIEGDPEVVFVERFDEGSIAAARARWDNVDSEAAMSLSSMAPPGSASLTSSKWHYESSGAFTVGFLKNLAGFDQLWFRYYVLYPKAADPIWHFFRMGGGSPYGGAGQKPDGTDRFVSSVEPNYDRQKWDFYTYWVDMRPASDNSYYGDNFLGEDFNPCKDLGPPVQHDAWVSVEMMIKVNAVGQFDGEQAFWINGQPVSSGYSGGGAAQVISAFGPGFPKGEWITAHFCPDTAGKPFDGASGKPGNGMRWRTAPALNLTYIRPLVYNDHAQPNAANDVYVANLVVAKKYIGPIAACP